MNDMANETAVYTHGHHESVLRSHRWRTAANSAAYLLGELKPHMRILDVGCGPGTITADLAELVPQGEVIGLDSEPGILEQARREAQARGLGNVSFTTGDVNALGYPDASFCVVHAHQVLQHVGDPVGALREMRRVTKPGGIVAVRDSDYAGFVWYPQIPALDDWLDLYRRVARANGGEPDAGRRLRAWARRPDSPTSPRRRPPGATPPRRSGTGGAGCGPTARSSPPTRTVRSRGATPRRATCGGSPAAGGSGPRARTAGSASRTARSSAA
ncbi:methyltransferase domain-containing protein [Microbispora bryophytorum subsp. camponoti]